jgi:hypothetical protein
VAQLVRGDPGVGFAPFPAADRITFDPFVQIFRCHWISVNTDILREETREALKTASFQIAIGIVKRSDEKRKPRDKSQGCFCVAVNQAGHGVELTFMEEKHVTTTREKRINAAQQVGDFWSLRCGIHRSCREAKDPNRRRQGISQFNAKLVNTRSQNLHMNLRMSGIDMAEVSRREYDSFVV